MHCNNFNFKIYNNLLLPHIIILFKLLFKIYIKRELLHGAFNNKSLIHDVLILFTQNKLIVMENI